ncbi:MAG: hypothetical protein Q9187_008767, partial [Circinaria calcarea]
MEGKIDVTTLVVLAVATGLYFILEYFMGIKLDPKEPPLISSTIPYVGHIIGLIRNGTRYYAKMSAKHALPIYTLGMIGGKTYVVNSPDLVVAVQRNSKTLSFTPFIAQSAKRITLPSKEAWAALMKNLDGKEGDWGLNADTSRGMHAVLAPGKDLDDMNRAMVTSVGASVDKLCKDEETTTIDLMNWIRHEITMASTNAAYGPKNPFKDPEVEKGFWAFENDLTLLLVNVMPNLIASKGHKGRDKVFRAFAEFFQNGGVDSSSALIKVRYEANLRYGVPFKDMGRFEIGNAIGILVNTTPGTFWTLIHVFSNPAILEDLRAELSSIMFTTTEGLASSPVHHLDVGQMKAKCQLLTSIFQEVLRVHSFNASVRMVTEDTILNDRYLLKKGSIVQMPSLVIHSDPQVWGPTVKDFDPQRFIKTRRGKGEQKQHPGAFRAFGGGTTLCPGRHFATTEILSTVAMFVMRFEMEPVEGEWKLPTQ